MCASLAAKPFLFGVRDRSVGQVCKLSTTQFFEVRPANPPPSRFDAGALARLAPDIALAGQPLGQEPGGLILQFRRFIQVTSGRLLVAVCS